MSGKANRKLKRQMKSAKLKARYRREVAEADAFVKKCRVKADTVPMRQQRSEIGATSHKEQTLLLTPKEVQRLLQVSRSTLDRMGDAVPGRCRVGGQVRYGRVALEVWVMKGCRS